MGLGDDECLWVAAEVIQGYVYDDNIF